MKLFRSMTKMLAAGAAVSLLAVPIASADHRRGDHAHRGHQAHNGHQRAHAYRGHNNHVRRNNVRRHNDYRRGNNYRRHNAYKRPVYHRPVYNRPVYRRPVYRNNYVHRPYHRGSNVTFTYNTGNAYYAPRYAVGHRYAYHPRTVYVRDYGRYGLYAPPRGHHWVHDHNSGDAILASVATGAIIGLAIGAIAAH